jgi:hypothetical protein
VIRWACAGAAGAVVSGFAFLLLTGQYINEGPVLVTVAPDHGLHEGDIFVIGGWVVAIAALVLLAFLPGRTRSR